ncbi:RNA-binding protein FUS-like [Phyllostomus discolor]|uniref:RNA-binding protein FUS-like n=1 Tax=Phyllostomus discolor TaxID=89673 RepID=A0A7E6D3J5_9CHIR|nr:RNA-binding protein FUS-like [Phyllostomus discolor]
MSAYVHMHRHGFMTVPNKPPKAIGTCPTQPAQGHSQQSYQPCGHQSYSGYSQSGDSLGYSQNTYGSSGQAQNTGYGTSQLPTDIEQLVAMAVASFQSSYGQHPNLAMTHSQLLAAPQEVTVVVLRAITRGRPTVGVMEGKGEEDPWALEAMEMVTVVVVVSSLAMDSSYNRPQCYGQQNQYSSSSGGGGEINGQDQSHMSGGSCG